MEERRWETMESDCLVNIFQRLGLDDLTLSVPFVCRPWLQVSLHPICWKSLNFRLLDFKPWSDFVKRFKVQYSIPSFSFTGFMRLVLGRSHGSVVEIRFPLMFGASLKDVVYASKECPRLETLILPKLLREDEAEIPEIIGKWKHLKRLEMESKPSCFPEMANQIGMSCKNFCWLRMAGSIGTITKEDASSIVQHLPRLTFLNLSKSFLPKEQLLVIMEGCQKLERLIVRDCIGFEADDDALKRASGITNFEFEGSKMEYDYDKDEGDEFFAHVI